MLLLPDLLLLGFEESLFNDSTLEAALRFILFTYFFFTKLMDFENSEIGGCCKFGAGGKSSLKFCLQVAVSLAPKPADVQICRFGVTADLISQHSSRQ